MKDDFSTVNQYRVRSGPMGSDDGVGRCGAFQIPLKNRTHAVVVANDGEFVEWEHVSVHVRYKNRKGKWIMRTPTWEEMSRIKDLFWDDEETVMELHVPKSDHINIHKHCLHLWKPVLHKIPVPPPELVGPKNNLGK